jgi:hypothetical protein
LLSQHPPQRWHETTRYGFYFMPGVRPPTRGRRRLLWHPI